MNPLRRLLLISTMFASLFLSACATLNPAYDLSKVKFRLDHISAVSVAGIDLMDIGSLNELNVFQMARATLAVSRENLPLDLTLHLKSENPLANKIAATLTRIDWTLILDDRETISGILEENVTLAAGEMQDIPLRLSLNMFEFFNERNSMDLLDLALAFASQDGGIPPGVALKIRPTIDTPFGPITYGKSFIVEAGKRQQKKKSETQEF
jgi:hypothetical protein